MRSPIDRFREIERGRALFNVADGLYFLHAPRRYQSYQGLNIGHISTTNNVRLYPRLEAWRKRYGQIKKNPL